LEVGETAKVETVCLSPSILTVWMFGAVEGIASVLQGFARVAGCEEGFGEDDAELDREPSEAAGVREKDAGFGFDNCLGVVP
jgi:hypothetical protein